MPVCVNFKEPVVGIRDRLYGFVKFCPRDVETEHREQNEDLVKTDMAMDISFGSSGFGLVLARAFKSVSLCMQHNVWVTNA